jgi:hypothetical protein
MFASKECGDVSTPKLQFGVRHRVTSDGAEAIVECADYVAALDLHQLMIDRGCTTSQIIVRTVYPWRVAE